MLRGFANKVIARQLGLQVGTVKIHLHHIYRKLSVPNCTVFLLNTLSKKQSKGNRVWHAVKIAGECATIT